MSVCLSVHVKQTDSHRTDFHDILHLELSFQLVRWHSSFVWKLIKIAFYLKAFGAGLHWSPSLMLCSLWGTPLCQRKHFCNWERMCSLRRVIWDWANRTWSHTWENQQDAHFFLTLNLLMWKIWRASNNASRWQMEFNSAFKGLIIYFAQENGTG
jgi:hypothetical protein